MVTAPPPPPLSMSLASTKLCKVKPKGHGQQRPSSKESISAALNNTVAHGKIKSDVGLGWNDSEQNHWKLMILTKTHMLKRWPDLNKAVFLLRRQWYLLWVRQWRSSTSTPRSILKTSRNSWWPQKSFTLKKIVHCYLSRRMIYNGLGWPVRWLWMFETKLEDILNDFTFLALLMFLWLYVVTVFISLSKASSM